MLKLIGAIRHKTDYSRWANARSIYSSWEPRTEMAADLVPNHSRVIEFGAARRALEKYLDPSCVYTASDLVDRGLGTIVCDLNESTTPGPWRRRLRRRRTDGSARIRARYAFRD